MPKRKITHPPNDQRVKVDDLVVRIIGIPFFGIVIPSATGLIHWDTNKWWFILLCFAYYILLAFLIWQGNRYLLFRNYYNIFFKDELAAKKYLLMVALNVFYTAPVTFLFLLLWKLVFLSYEVTWNSMFITVVVNVVCVIFVTNIYEKVLHAKWAELERTKLEQLEKAKVLAELEALKNQLDPHFMFNALNTISFLIENDVTKAHAFIDNLAEVYRYILRSKDKDLVLLHDEIIFMQAYQSLMEIRYEQSFMVDMRLVDEQTHTFLIPPVSMMVAIENAVKHNEISKKNNLVLYIACNKDWLTITNKITTRKQNKESTKTGLKNLNERFFKIVGKGIITTSENGIFTLQLPLLKLNNI
jgi:sensor histidine kinase YesM